MLKYIELNFYENFKHEYLFMFTMLELYHKCNNYLAFIRENFRKIFTKINLFFKIYALQECTLSLKLM